MDDLKKYALEDEDDDFIESEVNLLNDRIFTDESDNLSMEFSDEESFHYAENEQSKNAFSSDYGLKGAAYHTIGSAFSDGKTIYGSNGVTYNTIDNVFSDGKTTYGSDGSSFQTIDSILSDGKTTYGSNGVTYKTEKKMFGEGTVIYGSDGSEYESTKDIFGNKITERRR